MKQPTYRACPMEDPLSIRQLFTFSKRIFPTGYFFPGESHDFYEVVAVLSGQAGTTTGGAIGGHSGVTMALGQATPIGADHQRHMAIGRSRQTQSPLKKDLRRRRRQQVISSNDFRDAHEEVVDRARERVARPELVARQREVPERPRHVLLVMPREGIVEGDNGVLGDPESPAGGKGV